MVSVPLQMYIDSFNRGSLPLTLSTANISVILKRDKPPDMCGSSEPFQIARGVRQGCLLSLLLFVLTLELLAKNI